MSLQSLKCLYILPDLSGGGAERGALELMRALPAEGIDVDLLLFKDCAEHSVEGIGEASIMPLLRPDQKVMLNLHRFLPAARRIASKYDIMVAGLELESAYLATFLGKLHRKRIVWTIHNNMSEYLKRHRMSSYHRFLTPKLSRYCDSIICVSEGCKTDLVQNFGIPAEAVSVIYNPHDIAAIQRSAMEELPPEELAIFDKPVVVSAGRFTEQKGQDILLRAFHAVLERGHDCNLLILGRGELEAELRSLASDLGIASNVFMPGFKRNPHSYVARSTVFALSSRYEGFGRVLVEAMACGCPIVSTDCPSGPSEVLGGGKYGVLVEPGSVDELADALHGLLSDETRRKDLAKLGLDRARSFNTPIIAKQYAEVLTSL